MFLRQEIVIFKIYVDWQVETVNILESWGKGK